MSFEIEKIGRGLDLNDKRLLFNLRLKHKIKSVRLLRKVWTFIKSSKSANTHQPPVSVHFNEINDLIVIFRHVYVRNDPSRFPNKSRPEGFDHLKCFKNLVETIDSSKYGNRVRLIMLYNGTEEEFCIDPISKFLEKSKTFVKIYLHDARSAIEAVLLLFKKTLQLNLHHDDVVYFLENDYIHHANWVDEVFSVFQSNIKFEYLSLYDHPDRYRFPDRYSNSTVFVTDSRHWVTAPSTCGSFLTRFSQFIIDFKCIYSVENDHQMFLRLTKRLGRLLLTPLPGLSVHCMTEYLDPLQRFEEYFKNKNA